MTTITWKILQKKSYGADLSKFCINFALAETVTINLGENEVNGRFSTTLSTVHVAVMDTFDFTSLPKLLTLDRSLHIWYSRIRGISGVLDSVKLRIK